MLVRSIRRRSNKMSFGSSSYGRLFGGKSVSFLQPISETSGSNSLESLDSVKVDEVSLTVADHTATYNRECRSLCQLPGHSFQMANPIVGAIEDTASRTIYVNDGRSLAHIKMDSVQGNDGADQFQVSL